MKILLIHQYFKTPEEGGGIRSWYIAEGLIERGFDVTILTSHNELSGKHIIENVPVTYFKIPYDNSFSFRRRIKAFLVFSFKCILHIHRSKTKWDLLYVISTPLTTGLVGLFSKKFRKMPYIFEVGDLWPAVPVSLGLIKNKWLKKSLFQFEKVVYRNSLWISALSPSIKDYIDYEIGNTPRIKVLPNMSDCVYFRGTTVKSQNQQLRILYAGTVGQANKLEYLLDTAKLCQEKNIRISFTIMGKGGRLTEIKKLASELDNIRFLPHQKMEDVRKELENHDAIYISFIKDFLVGTGCPNKLMDGLAAGKLIVVNYTGWVKSLIEKKECGFGYDPEEPGQFIDMISPFIQSNSLLEQYQTNARELAVSSFSKEIILRSLVEEIQPSAKVI